MSEQQQFREQAFPAESGTLPHRPWTPMSLVNGRGPQAKRCGRDEAKRKSVRKRLPLRGSRCVEILRGSRWHHQEATASREGARHIGKQLHSAKQGAIGTSNLPNRSIATRILRQCIIEKQLPPGKAQSTIGKQLHSAKQGTFGRATCRTSSIATHILPQSTIVKQPHSAKHGTIGE